MNQSATAAAPESPRPARRIRTLWSMLALVAAPVLLIDQVSKLYIAGHLKPFQMIPIIPHIFDVTYTLNPGAAFSIFANLPSWFRGSFLFAISAIAIAILFVLLARSSRVSSTTIALALVLGGAIGNLIDRAVRGRVIDFIYFHYYAYSYPVFNLADSAITIGVAIILLELLFGHDAHRQRAS